MGSGRSLLRRCNSRARSAGQAEKEVDQENTPVGSPPVLVSTTRPNEANAEERARQSLRVQLDRTANVRVLSGVPRSKIYVGGKATSKAYAQNPASCGDSWEFDFEAQPGGYEISFLGGDNPHHGILDVIIDSESIGQVDQYSDRDKYPSEHVLYWECNTPGKHTLQGVVRSKQERSVNYWMCLSAISFKPSVRRRVFVLLVEATHTGPTSLEVRCTSMSGCEVAVIRCEEHHTVGELRALVTETLDFAWDVALTLPNNTLLDTANDGLICSEALCAVHD